MDHFAQAAKLIDAERYDEAVDLMVTHLAASPDDAEAHYQLGSAHDAAGREAEAVGPYERALELGLTPDRDLATRIQLASTLRNLGRSDEAVTILREALAARPGHRAARMFLALALVDSGEPREAVHELLDLLLTDPGPPEAYARSLRWYADDLVGNAAPDD